MSELTMFQSKLAESWPRGDTRLAEDVDSPYFLPVTEEILAEITRRIVAYILGNKRQNTYLLQNVYYRGERFLPQPISPEPEPRKYCGSITAVFVQQIKFSLLPLVVYQPIFRNARRLIRHKLFPPISANAFR